MHKGVCVSGSREQTTGSVSSQQYPRLPFIMLVIVITDKDKQSLHEVLIMWLLHGIVL